MASSHVEIIDLTSTGSQSPLPPFVNPNPKSFRQTNKRRKREQARAQAAANASKDFIYISDSEGRNMATTQRKAPEASSHENMTDTANPSKRDSPEEGEVTEDIQDPEEMTLVKVYPTTPISSKRVFSSKTQMEGRNTSPAPSLFYVDTDAAAPLQLVSESVPDSVTPQSLLLPSHVEVDSTLAETSIIAAKTSMLESEVGDDFIHFADMDARGFTRYFEEPEDDNERRAHLVCGYCGAEGDHKTTDCTVTVCLTCGAHDEHTTRQCPIIKTCFNCGMKGHINRDCPNRFTSRRLFDRDLEDCARCGSVTHSVKECPTLWRLYEYLDDADHERTLKTRRDKEELLLGEGGEGYIGEDMWCYNCGGEGHLGDDCQISPRQPDCKESSAFGEENVMTGPFSNKQLISSGRKLRREWEDKNTFGDGHGFAGPSDVGKRGRDKERERMRRKEKEVREIDDDEGDWFGRRTNFQAEVLPSAPKKMLEEKFTFSLKDTARFEDKKRPGDRLLARIDMESIERNERAYGTRDRDRERDRDRDRERERDRDRHRRDGPKRDSRGSSRRERERKSGKERSKTNENRRDDARSGRQYYGGYGR